MLVIPSTLLAVLVVALTSLGPLSDRFGRRPVLLWGMLVFLHASVVCALADSIATLVVARLLQAFGACAGMLVGHGFKKRHLSARSHRGRRHAVQLRGVAVRVPALKTCTP